VRYAKGSLRVLKVMCKGTTDEVSRVQSLGSTFPVRVEACRMSRLESKIDSNCHKPTHSSHHNCP